MTFKPLLHRLVNSPYLDLIGVTIVVAGSLSLHYHLDRVTHTLSLLGCVSILSTSMSLMSTRLVSRQKNLGNVIGVFTALSSAVIDFLLGIRSAWLTYPISMLANLLAALKWQRGVKVRSYDRLYWIILMASMLLGALLTWLGARLASTDTFNNIVAWCGLQPSGPITMSTSLFVTTSLITGFAFVSNTANILKYEETWLTWMCYNLTRLFQSLLTLNIANAIKYIFYIFNAVITFIDWRLSRAPSPAAQERTSHDPRR
ncbi:nicotinamide mononucleotide transporter [Zymobacter sp. IVIA_5232.4 C2]|uniref:nicotinamide mononucleotide transporter n=1 Tax=Zymobacter sp. IVIA_5232.4 C2 TaxID=3394855 RepID=UPI0039C02F2B